MKIEIITVGNELLSGKTINLNATYLSKTLLKAQYETSYVSVYPDDKKELQKGIKLSLDRANVIIITGGLGPTLDDNTKEIVSDLLKIPLKYRKDIALDIEKRFGCIASIEEQATVFQTGYIFKNEVGTAPGFAFIYSGKAIILLPGVPSELKDMFEKHALLFIQKHFPPLEKAYQEIVNICLLPELKIDASIKALQLDEDIKIGIYPAPGFVQVTISAKSKDQTALKKINHIKNQIAADFQDYIYKAEDGKIECAIHDILINRDEKIAFAESCTGGVLSSKITALGGASKYFLGSFITYSNDLKKSILNVSETTLKEKGAVSVQAIKEMIEGVFKLTDATYAIAISGIAGPGGATLEKPIGTICLAIAKRGDDIDAGILHLNGSRSTIIEWTANIALGSLFRKIAHNLTYFDQ